MAMHISWVHNYTLESDKLRQLVVKHFVRASWTLGIQLESEEEMWARVREDPKALIGAHDGKGWYGNKVED